MLIVVNGCAIKAYKSPYKTAEIDGKFYGVIAQDATSKDDVSGYTSTPESRLKWPMLINAGLAYDS